MGLDDQGAYHAEAAQSASERSGATRIRTPVRARPVTAMGAVRTLHRWAGGVIGLFLAIVGATGAILMHREAWIQLFLPPTNQPEVPAASESEILRGLIDAEGVETRFVVFPSDAFPFFRLMGPGDEGAYAQADGVIVDQWISAWARPEEWMFDLHATLMAGAPGETLNGIFALFGLAFVITGIILWWPARRLFRPRLLPKALSRGAVIAHHRDLGVIVAPLLALSLITGAMLTLRPVAALLILPFSSQAEISEALAAPKAPGARYDPGIDWAEILATSRAHFPDAEVRIIGVPRTPDQPIFVRMRQPSEWTKNGRTMVWFHPETGALIKADDAFAAPTGIRLFFKVLPLHAGEVGGLVYRLLMTTSGVALALLGSLTVWTFWFKRRRKKR